MDIHDLQSRISVLEVEKSVVQGEKTDLLEDINRLTRRCLDKDAQIAKLTRLLEGRDQTIAELTPFAKDSSRITKMQKGTWSAKDGKWNS